MNYFEKATRNKLILALFLMEIGSVFLVGAIAIATLRSKEALARLFLTIYKWPGQMNSAYDLSIKSQTLLELHSIFAIFGIMIAMIASCYVLLKLPYKRSAVIATIIVTMFGFNAHTHLTDWLTNGSYSRYQEAKTEFNSLMSAKYGPDTSNDETLIVREDDEADETSLAETISEMKDLLENATDDAEAEYLKKAIAATEKLERGEISEEEYFTVLLEIQGQELEQDLLTLTERYLLLIGDLEPYADTFKGSFQLASIILATMIILDPLPHRLLARRRRSGDLRDGIEVDD